MPTIKPITKTEHAGKYLKKSAGYQFAANEALATLVVEEMPRAALLLPLAFTLDHEQKAIPVMIQGLKPGTNLLVDSVGKWHVGYIPAIYRSYPFSLGQTEDGQQLLCIDEDSGLVHESEGEPFFGDDGEPATALKDVFNFLSQVHKSRQLTQKICATLQRYDLIEPWPITINTSDGKTPIKGLERINEKQLNALDTESFEQVRKSGALPLIYCQLLSMQHLPNLIKLAAQINQQTTLTEPEIPDIDKLFGEGSDDIFHF